MKPVFSNGFESWHETHFEVVQEISNELSKVQPEGIVKKMQDEFGHGGLYILAFELTNEFEKLNKGRQWDGEFFDEIETFLAEKLKA